MAGTVVVGVAFVDIKGFPFGKYDPQGRNLGSVRIVHGGVSRNVVENFANLGMPVSFAGMLEDSAIGNDVARRLADAGADLSHMLWVEENGLGMWLVLLDENGNLAGSISRMPDLSKLEDYFLRNADGKIFSYFGKHPVLNMGNPDVVKWYTGIVDQAIKNGLGAIYTDMGGALTGNIDFSGEESGTGLEAIIPIYQYYHKNNIQFGIEGQTPLGLNSFWYRRQLYNPFSGNEFSLIGSLCYTNEVDDIDLDYFRMAMYDCFMLTHVEGYAFKFERRPQEIELIARAGKLNPKINEALKVTGMPFIRETACGTSWVGKDGAAIFCYDPVKKLTVNYNGKTETFTDVPGDSILIIRK